MGSHALTDRVELTEVLSDHIANEPSFQRPSDFHPIDRDPMATRVISQWPSVSRDILKGRLHPKEQILRVCMEERGISVDLLLATLFEQQRTAYSSSSAEGGVQDGENLRVEADRKGRARLHVVIAKPRMKSVSIRKVGGFRVASAIFAKLLHKLIK